MRFRCYGVEKEPDTVKLAKMNLLLNNVRGDITEANSYYSDSYNAGIISQMVTLPTIYH